MAPYEPGGKEVERKLPERKAQRKLKLEVICSWEGVFVATDSRNRKVLVLSDGPYVRNLLSLMEKFEGQNGKDGERVLATVHRQPFDAIVLDLRWPEPRTRDEIRGMGKFRPAWMGKLLVITAEINGPKTLDILERYLINGLPQALLWLISHRYQTA